MKEAFVGDTVTINLATSFDLTGYTLKIMFQRPDGTIEHWDATIDPDDSTHMFYTTLDTDLDQSGEWLLQAYIDFGGIYLHGKWAKLTVLTPLTELV